MIRTDHILGGAVLAGGVFLLVYLIPNEVTAAPERLRNPALFPTMAAWLLVLLGVLQIVFAGPKQYRIDWPGLGRGLAVFAILVAAAIALPIVGFVPMGIGMMALFGFVMMYERRPHWLLVTIAASPVLTWALFEIAFQRPLP
ncbi:hypothetical protein HKCCE2091_03420 [Rhodobacterales bacterium HKCCE2091]|nr:hypothetical protein [Rhodobacterales bacterium HKCCE2091]